MWLLLKSLSSVILIFAALHSVDAWSAACCARSAAAPFLILTDDEAQLSFGVSAVDAVAHVDPEGYLSSPAGRDFTSQFRADGAVLVSDRWQLGISAALVGRSINPSTNPDFNLGMGDTRLSFGYEVLPSWSYSVWRPQGFLFAVVSLPTGKSKYEKSDHLAGADVTGLGFYSAALGGILLKRWKNFDAFVIGEFHYSLPRTFGVGANSLAVTPGFGVSTGLGLGWSPNAGAFRLGFRLQPRVDQLPQERGVLSAPSPSGVGPHLIANCDTGFDLSYMLGSSQTLMVSYTDQTLLGHAVNTNLNRVIAFNFQHRWDR
jgi:hypothetical protein